MHCGRRMLAQTILLIVAMITPLLLAVLADMDKLSFPNPGRRHSAFYWVVIILTSGGAYIWNKRRTVAARRTLAQAPGSISHPGSFRAAYAVGVLGMLMPLLFPLAILVAMMVLYFFPDLQS